MSISSVADPGCLSRIPDPDFYPSRIPDPGSKNSNKRERWKKISCHTFLCSHKCHKIVNYFIFEVLKKKIWANFQRIIELFTKKIVKKLLKIWSWDPGSGIRDPGSWIRKKPIPDPGSRIQGSKSTQSRIPDPDPQHWVSGQQMIPQFRFVILILVLSALLRITICDACNLWILHATTFVSCNFAGRI